MDYHATRARGDRKTPMRLPLVALSALIFGCSSPLTDARTSFDEGRYPEAVAEYRAFVPQLPALGRTAQFEYALYRGLAHLALGDAGPAERWLVLAKRLCEQSPELATAEQHGRLMSAWRSMGHMPGD